MESERLPANVDVVGWLVSTSGIASAIFWSMSTKKFFGLSATSFFNVTVLLSLIFCLNEKVLDFFVDICQFRKNFPNFPGVVFVL